MPGPDERPPRPQRTEPGVGRFVRVQRTRGPVTLDQTGSAEVTTEDGTTMTVLTFRVTYTGKVTAEDGDDLTIVGCATVGHEARGRPVNHPCHWRL